MTSNISKEAIAETLNAEIYKVWQRGGEFNWPSFMEAPHINEQVRELDALVDKLQDVLGEISGMGVSQSAARNMPSADWYYKLFSTCQRLARDGEKKIKEARGL